MKYLLLLLLLGCHLTDRERPETAQYEMNIRIIENAGDIRKGMEQDSLELKIKE